MYIITELSTILHQLEHVSYETVAYLHVLLNKKKIKSQHFTGSVWPSIGLCNLVNFPKMVINTLDYRLEKSRYDGSIQLYKGSI